MILALTATGVLLLGGGAPAAACSPCPYLSAQERERRTEAVVEGVVTDVDRPWSGDRWVATFRVDRVLKGYPETELRLDTQPPDTFCGGPVLVEGYRYRLYLTRVGGRMVPAFCGGSTGLSDGPVLPWWRLHDEWLLAAAGAVLSNGIASALIRSLRTRRSRVLRNGGRSRPAPSAP
jgi:hypothetical protein